VMTFLWLVALLIGTGDALHLHNISHWQEEVAGKQIVMGFLNHPCIKPGCDKFDKVMNKLVEQYENTKTLFVHLQHCGLFGKKLCEDLDVMDNPEIKYGHPDDMQQYTGSLKFADIKKFVVETYGPPCGVDSLDLCDDDQKQIIEAYKDMSTKDLQKEIREKEKKIQKIEADSDAYQRTHQHKQRALTDNLYADRKRMRNSGLHFMRAVQFYRNRTDLLPKQKEDSEEELEPEKIKIEEDGVTTTEHPMTKVGRAIAAEAEKKKKEMEEKMAAVGKAIREQQEKAGVLSPEL